MDPSPETDLLPPTCRVRAELLTLEDAIFAGGQAVTGALQNLDTRFLFEEGALVLRGQTLLNLKGELRQFVAARAAVSKLLPSLMGVATLGRLYADALKGATTTLLTPEFLTADEAGVFAVGTGHKQVSPPMPVLDAPTVHAWGGLKAVAEHFLSKPLQVAVECLDADSVLTAARLGFRLLVVNTPALAQTAPAHMQTWVRGAIGLEDMKVWRDVPVDFIQPDILRTSVPRTELQWTYQTEGPKRAELRL